MKKINFALLLCFLGLNAYGNTYVSEFHTQEVSPKPSTCATGLEYAGFVLVDPAEEVPAMANGYTVSKPSTSRLEYVTIAAFTGIIGSIAQLYGPVITYPYLCEALYLVFGAKSMFAKLTVQTAVFNLLGTQTVQGSFAFAGGVVGALTGKKVVNGSKYAYSSIKNAFSDSKPVNEATPKTSFLSKASSYFSKASSYFSNSLNKFKSLFSFA